MVALDIFKAFAPVNYSKVLEHIEGKLLEHIEASVVLKTLDILQGHQTYVDTVKSSRRSSLSTALQILPAHRR